MEINRRQQNISIAVFDSGIGGLNILKRCTQVMPDADYYYLADNYNVPYGNKSKEQIFNLVKSRLDCVADKNLSAAVIACNTATSNCIEELRAAYSFPIVGIQPAIKPAAEFGGKCLVLATPATVGSPSFNDLLARYGNTDFTVCPCFGLADYIEKNVLKPDADFLKELLPEAITDSVVLGCTHYVFIKDLIKRRYGCAVFDGVAGTVDHLRQIVGMTDHFAGKTGTADHRHNKMLNITFIGGDSVKNAKIFNFLLNK